MANKPLIKTNPYLKDPAKRRGLFIATVLSSTAIEGVHIDVELDARASDLFRAPVNNQLHALECYPFDFRMSLDKSV